MSDYDESDDAPSLSQQAEEEDEDDLDGFYEDEFEEAMSNCGLMPNGLCMKAGSEECDWECPFS